MTDTAHWPLVVYLALCFALIGFILVLSHLLGPRHKEHATEEIFESGVVTLGLGRFRLSAKFYLIAMFFVVFDMEAVFIYAWAVAARETGWPGYVEMVIFTVILLAALVYLWRVGALDWSPEQKSKLGSMQRRPHARGVTVASTPRSGSH